MRHYSVLMNFKFTYNIFNMLNIKTYYVNLYAQTLKVTIIACIIASCLCVDYKEEYLDQKVDHFNFLSNSNKTFPQRYLYNDSWWDVGKGPIFFYTGNEGDIVGFWKNTGFMFEIAPQFHALILFGEHRYYGKSLPFGNSSFDGKLVGYLSVEQAIADYAFMIDYVKLRFKAENCPVIAFGGSYGGMLAAYMRFRYPNIIKGSIAASAPIYQVSGYSSGNLFFQAVTKVFNTFHDCQSSVRFAFTDLESLFYQATKGPHIISQKFHLCHDLISEKDFNHFLLWVKNAFVMTAMMNYPYPASFMGNFPAFPVKVMCSLMTGSGLLVDNMYKAISIYYNSSGNTQCFDIYKEYIYCADPTGCGLGFDSKAWDYQACTEINLEGGTNNVTDMFPAQPFNSSMRDEYCLKTWNVLPRRNWLRLSFWGKDITSASNIVFSNGDLDPWSVGGVLKNISDSLVAVVIKGGAHHLDLRGHNPKDPASVLAARVFEINNIKRWLTSK